MSRSLPLVESKKVGARMAQTYHRNIILQAAPSSFASSSRPNQPSTTSLDDQCAPHPDYRSSSQLMSSNRLNRICASSGLPAGCSSSKYNVVGPDSAEGRYKRSGSPPSIGPRSPFLEGITILTVCGSEYCSSHVPLRVSEGSEDETEDGPVAEV